jgi:hypothetical protein
MLNYQYINLNYESRDIHNLLNRDNPNYCRGCSLLERRKIIQMLKLPFPVKSILYFIINPKTISFIHKDIDLDNPANKPNFALNLPLLNCEMTYMKWYEAVDESDIEIFGGPSNGAKTPMLKSENSKCIDESNSNHPQIVNVLDWHSIENKSDNDSKIISIRFQNDIKLESLIEFISVSPIDYS